jgi:hypothetical protein
MYLNYDDPYFINWPGSTHLQYILNDPKTNTSLNVLIAEGSSMRTGNGEVDRVLQNYPTLTAYAYKSIRKVIRKGRRFNEKANITPFIKEKRVALTSQEFEVMNLLFDPKEVQGENKQELAEEMQIFLCEQAHNKENEKVGEKMYFWRDPFFGFFSIDMETKLSRLKEQMGSSNKET